ncbi:universal stress protein [Haladaptatus pallidirubidus]|uniref:Universal stress protein n=1 Tax=Haladaptatus pallidirubidus TaxID=1008152 RepID=A0AAV3UPU3_9EURY|nr:universal stress protein [Haladaptatus pallidirubidus]
MYESVLFPTDGSETATQAREHAFSHAAAYDASFHILSVTDTRFYTTSGEEFERETVKSEQVLNETTAAAPEGITVSAVVRDGNPADEIVSYADKQEIDLIIMATHGRKGVDRFLHGSITETVLRTAEQPVLAVRVQNSSE